jgi:putative hemolysin
MGNFILFLQIAFLVSCHGPRLSGSCDHHAKAYKTLNAAINTYCKDRGYTAFDLGQLDGHNCLIEDGRPGTIYTAIPICRDIK